MAHRTTWECPERRNEHKDRNGEVRRNPYRNQIDYVITRCMYRNTVKNARSYSGINTDTDHRLVVMEMKCEWFKMYKKKTKVEAYDVQKLRDVDARKNYTQKISETYELNKEGTAQEKWNRITKSCLESAKENLEKPRSDKKYESIEITNLSCQQKKIRNDINATNNKERKIKLKKERNKIISKIHNLIQEEKITAEIEKIEELEKVKNDSTKMFQAARKLQQSKPKKPLMVDGTNGITTNVKEQLEIITTYFRSVFYSELETDMPIIPPKEMKMPFSKEEVRKAVSSLKNNKSAGCDEIKAELIKCSPPEILEGIAELLNYISKTGDYPTEIKTGILVPLPKPAKKPGPPQHLRPIILLSILRKILAIIMIRRTADKINSKIPISQAAYRSGRSTTEHVFTIKTLAEKAITSSNYEIMIVLLDMSKAFDTIKRDVLIEDLRTVLEEDELHMFSLLLKDVKLQVRVKDQLGDQFNTNIGTPQGDSASALLFTFYLAQALKDNKSPTEEEHNYAQPKNNCNLPPHLSDHSYYNKLPQSELSIQQQYADDISWITTNKGLIEHVKKEIPEKLRSKNLMVNKDKTEEYEIKKEGSDEWKKCKYLGTLLDTEKDIQRRKGLAIDTFNQNKHTLTSKCLSMNIKTRIFEAYVNSIFLYNSETWTLTKQLEKNIDVFQRTLLRMMLNVKKIDKIKNEEIHKKTNIVPWSETIKRRRLNWFGHLIRLDEKTPVKQAFEEALRYTKKPQGRPKPTWIALIKKDLYNIDPLMNLQRAEEIAKDRIAWRKFVCCAMAKTGRKA
jgi:sorting nexin-29